MAFLAPIVAGIGSAIGGAASAVSGAVGGLGGLGSILSAGSTILGGIASANEANYQAKIAQNNAQIAKQNADYSIEAGQQQAEATSRKAAATAGAIIASEAANGVDVNTGSNADVRISQRELGKLDSETVLNNAMLQAYGYRTQQTNYLAQASLDKAQAANAPWSAALGAAGSFLGDAKGIGGKWSGVSNGNVGGDV